MKIYNTLTKKIDEFIPNEEGKVTMYTCGPTVYNYAHIGNLRTYISEDILQKTLEYIGYDVNRCMNITDVGHLVSDGDEGEDKMAVASRREKKSALEIASFYTDAFMKDIEKLNIKKPAIISKATDNIDEYIKVIEKLINDGYAYVADGNVYFDTTKYKDYYKLSNRNPLEQQAAIRDDVEIDKAKKNVNDFGLWFTNSKFNDQELKWDSPWGVGYPGWHIECSCISLKYLGEKLDIHCGAVDAIFPHHTNEIAQSECFLGHKWCNYWVHMEFLNDKSGKMSKSKGEFLTLSLLEEKGYTPLEYRFFCLNSHYRNVLEFSYETMDSSKTAYHKLLNRIGSLKEEGTLDQEAISRYKDKFKEALKNDLNTALAITTLYDVLKDSSISDVTKLELIADFDKVLSLDLLKKDAEIDKDLEEYILKEIERRNEAKKNKDFALADQIRDELKTKGITLIDSREGTTYKVE
ncbi:MAG: cysteine--tRNA ligase [Bacilli bacterium]|nr:cysteine--tRNA ligase [Bacilli bacterium]